MNPAICILNGVDVTEYVRGAETLSERIYYDNELRGYLLDVLNEVEFHGAAYEVLQDAFLNDFDTPLPFLVSVFNVHTGTYDNVFNSLIFVAQGEFNLYRKTFTVSPTDRSFFAKIRHNANLDFTIGSGVSKLGADISARSGGVQMRYYNNQWVSPNLFSGSMPCNTAFQALDFLLAAMTDGDLPLVSDFFTTGAGKDYVIISGSFYCNRGAANRRPIVSWSELFGDLAKLFNLVFAIEVLPDNSFQMRIEPISYFRQQGITRIVNVKPDAVERIDASYLYAQMLVGSAKTAQRLAAPSATWQSTPIANQFAPPAPNFFNYIPETPFFFHVQESYIFEYQSNTENELNLRCSRLITDTNLHYFQMAQLFGKVFDEDRNTDYDEDVFLVHCTELSAGVFAPIFYTNATGLNYLNDPINNLNVGINNADGLPASAGILFSQFGSQSFRAAITAVPPTGQLFPGGGGIPKSSNVIFDNTGAPTGLWSTPLAYFSAPSPPIGSASVTAPNIWLRASFNDITVNGFDNSTGYDTTGAHWDTQIPALYQFRARLFIRHNHFGDPTKLCGFDLYVVQWDSGGAFKSAQRMLNFAQFTDPVNNPTSANTPIIGTSQIWREVEARTQLFNAALGDVFQVVMNVAPLGYGNQFEPNANQIIMTNDSHWEIMSSSLQDQGGTILESPKGGNFLVENEFDADIDAQLWNDIKANIFGTFLYQTGAFGEHRNGFLKDFEREIISGRTRCLTSARLAVQPLIDNINEPEVPPDEEE